MSKLPNEGLFDRKGCPSKKAKIGKFTDLINSLFNEDPRGKYKMIIQYTELNMEERMCIRDSARSLKKYGSTSSNSSTRSEHYIKHQVSSTDTLQGLALRYGVTTEQIRRANKLWQNDSLFLRSTLLIPVPGDGGGGGGGESSCTSPSDVELVEEGAAAPTHNGSSAVSPSHPHHPTSAGEESSFNDFLVKIDCSIASTKSQVLMSQDNSQFINEEDCVFVTEDERVRSRRQQRYSREGSQRHSSDGSTEMQPLCNGGLNHQHPLSNGGSTDLPTVVTRDRRTLRSLQRLQQTHDSMFQL